MPEPRPRQDCLNNGYGESSHVVWLKLAGLKDWELKPIVLDGDRTFVTRTRFIFEGPGTGPAARGNMPTSPFTPG